MPSQNSCEQPTAGRLQLAEEEQEEVPQQTEQQKEQQKEQQLLCRGVRSFVAVCHSGRSVTWS